MRPAARRRYPATTTRRDVMLDTHRSVDGDSAWRELEARLAAVMAGHPWVAAIYSADVVPTARTAAMAGECDPDTAPFAPFAPLTVAVLGDAAKPHEREALVRQLELLQAGGVSCRFIDRLPAAAVVSLLTQGCRLWTRDRPRAACFEASLPSLYGAQRRDRAANPWRPRACLAADFGLELQCL